MLTSLSQLYHIIFLSNLQPITCQCKYLNLYLDSLSILLICSKQQFRIISSVINSRINQIYYTLKLEKIQDLIQIISNKNQLQKMNYTKFKCLNQQYHQYFIKTNQLIREGSGAYKSYKIWSGNLLIMILERQTLFLFHDKQNMKTIRKYN
ncbi:hypothetical protein TTHERM_000353438 (macronuclear) [Tetrahymena thermophila SB210]|uniref:Uncharacterized protein n=1 Tax=Tetrahymena thermophila (strain SB210) TaxID=312017 RepID=W7XHD0_TETTS|nr:hypothetical protein TTHERM_000353438 [Tetrahymena thermophila SB210]EWS72474.1 hypothetical protein TTHERM_000353438 [Tetrahymena thermophila SB210]|eukprot:XP_012654971.1 hypothetical protein TTHERM_000353438 [Tetrahymena thermophila SB210]